MLYCQAVRGRKTAKEKRPFPGVVFYSSPWLKNSRIGSILSSNQYKNFSDVFKAIKRAVASITMVKSIKIIIFQFLPLIIKIFLLNAYI
jgi:hypothetical protein